MFREIFETKEIQYDFKSSDAASDAADTLNSDGTDWKPEDWEIAGNTIIAVNPKAIKLLDKIKGAKRV